MLVCHKVYHPHQKEKILKTLIKPRSLWIVSSLQHKFLAQLSRIQWGTGLIPSDVVLRASELWERILLEHQPQWHILDLNLATLFIEKWLPECVRNQNLHLSSFDAPRVYQTVGQILPLLCHDLGHEAIEEWFSQSLEAKDRWYSWYKASAYLWEKFLSQKMIPQEWVKGVLVHEDMASGESFIFDLGLDMNDVEGELILNLSYRSDVQVLVPNTKDLLPSYQKLLDVGQVVESAKDSFHSHSEYKKFPSQLSEIKEVVAQVRVWMEEGTPAHKIAVVSPVIENYWPTLSEHFLIEGIIFNKNITSPLSQFEIYQFWLSALRLSLGQGESLRWGAIFLPRRQESIYGILCVSKVF